MKREEEKEEMTDLTSQELAKVKHMVRSLVKHTQKDSGLFCNANYVVFLIFVKWGKGSRNHGKK